MRGFVFALVASTLLVPAPASGDDWPQWMGPRRDNVWRESGILEKFPAGGPKIVWRSPVAGGYSGPAVAGGKVYITDYVTQQNVKVENFERNAFTGVERVLCLDEATGKPLWKKEYPVEYAISYPAGPRTTPTVHEGKVYTLGAEGDLYCFDAKTGSAVWSKNLPKEYGAKTPLWGYAAHPLIDGEKLITLAGGDGSHVVALDKNTGKELWRALSAPEQGYSPPLLIQAGGARQLILLRPGAISSVDPETGKEYWSVPYEATNGAVIMTPAHVGDFLYAGGFSNKNLLLRLASNRPAVEEVYRDEPKSGVAPINVQPFAEGNVLYGFDQSGWMYAVELESGKRLWQSTAPIGSGRPANSGTAFIVRQGDRYWMFNELGELLIARLTPEGFEELDRAKVIEPSNTAFGREVVWSAPAFANRRAYLRNGQECICVDLSAGGAKQSSR
jgi:outer membrane protein assembly factor BamB